jgi:hypothetical protein
MEYILHIPQYVARFPFIPRGRRLHIGSIRARAGCPCLAPAIDGSWRSLGTVRTLCRQWVLDTRLAHGLPLCPGSNGRPRCFFAVLSADRSRPLPGNSENPLSSMGFGHATCLRIAALPRIKRASSGLDLVEYIKCSEGARGIGVSPVDQILAFATFLDNESRKHCGKTRAHDRGSSERHVRAGPKGASACPKAFAS